jgi:hypothetical protein
MVRSILSPTLLVSTVVEVTTIGLDGKRLRVEILNTGFGHAPIQFIWPTRSGWPPGVMVGLMGGLVGVRGGVAVVKGTLALMAKPPALSTSYNC